MIAIESQVLADLARNHIVPTAIRYQNELIENVKGLKDIFGSEFMEYGKEEFEFVQKISLHNSELKRLTEALLEDKDHALSMEDAQEKAEYFNKNVKPKMLEIRYHVDELEMMIDDEMWPLPKYREMMFLR